MIKDSITRYEALVALLAMPDPPEMPPRNHQYTCDRDSRWNADILKRNLGMAYVEWRRHDYGRDSSEVISMRKLRMVKRA